MKPVVSQAISYCAVSALALVVDIAILWLLVHSYSWWYLGAATASFAIGLLLNYALSVTWVFEQRRLADPTLEFAGFAAIGAVGLGINAAVIACAVKLFGANYLAGKCGAAGCTFLWNFAARRQILFVRPALEKV